jgi:hypothetical protein
MSIPRPIRPSAITCTRCGGHAPGPAVDKHADHAAGCTAPADFETAMAAARDAEAQATYEMAIVAATRGTRAVAEAAFIPGGPPVEDIQATYEQLQAETRSKAKAA